ncbi:hypothetical protein HJC23_009498 [Cyclotella cryptica]|uniref:Uncharacterized protein n=1 Tax=Cyclotella cryptica TaxID=29204 RepID=A0ABD3Q592_9STRA|eukprot:CCRYP_008816-RA/>CCRYP_008816-RA protein AED:0.29 eAED:0.29 QI:43/1/1/1/0/0/2/381/255
MSRYAWHPLHAPSLPTHAVASKIALIGPIGKCLETAVYELCDEDDAAEDGCNSDNGIDSSGSAVAETDSASELVHCPGPIPSKNDVDGSNKAPRSSYKLYPLKNAMDQAMAASILESYGHFVANTVFDNRKKTQSPSSTKDQLFTSPSLTAPAALLRGEIDHYNRIGGQWRVVVKNAILTSRNMAQVDNGRDGRGQRTRLMLDWDSKGASASNCLNAETGYDCINAATKKRKPKDREDSYHFKGKVQILAYDDDT